MVSTGKFLERSRERIDLYQDTPFPAIQTDTFEIFPVMAFLVTLLVGSYTRVVITPQVQGLDGTWYPMKQVRNNVSNASPVGVDTTVDFSGAVQFAGGLNFGSGPPCPYMYGRIGRLDVAPTGVATNSFLAISYFQSVAGGGI